MALKKCCCLLGLIPSWGNAALTADLNVSGRVEPPACSLTFGGAENGVFALGELSQGTLNRTSTTTLAESAAQVLNMACAGPTVVAFRAYSNQEFMPDAEHFSLGNDNYGNPIGYFRINLKQTQIIADGGVGTLKYSQDGGVSWSPAGNGTVMVNYPQQEELLGIDQQPASSTLYGVTSSSVPLTITPTIAARNALELDAPLRLEGSVTIELLYP